MPKTRLDILLVERGLADSRALAQRLIMAGQVRVAGQVAIKPATAVAPEAVVTLDHGPRFVSRGGDKLEAALAAFGVNVTGRVGADVGASTGGFTDCLLQHGAAKVYAIDVGTGILEWKLRQDPRVVVLEGTNARFLEHLPEPVTFVTVDASFISIKILLPVVKGWLRLPPQPLPHLAELRQMGNEQREGVQPGVIALIKPQFEAGRVLVARGKGVVRDPEVHRQVLLEVLGFAQEQGYTVRGLIRSPLIGPKGNAEFLAWLDLSGEAADLAALVETVVPIL